MHRITFLVGLILATGLPTSQAEVTNVSISELSFITGQWVTDRGEDMLEEVWSAPNGDSMMGMFRWMKNGEVWLYELLTIRKEKEGIVFRFRHFSDALVPWEPKEAPLTFTLVHFEAGEAVFENPEQDSPRRYSFIKEGEDGLRVLVQGFENGKLEKGSVFSYRRRR